ncbi:hypothetical protein ABW20_dc0103047 [Dactylellina cionopaga]|nr:hypothetical protein ABW20_dc0103047 [Dactylellina cionopaga]
MVGLNVPEDMRELYRESGFLYSELAQVLKKFDPLTLEGFNETLKAMHAYGAFMEAHGLNKRVVIQAGICQMRWGQEIPRDIDSSIYPPHLWHHHANYIPLHHRTNRLFFGKVLCPCGKLHPRPGTTSENPITDLNNFEPGLTYPHPEGELGASSSKSVSPLILVKQEPVEDNVFIREELVKSGYISTRGRSRSSAKKQKKPENILGVERKFTFGEPTFKNKTNTESSSKLANLKV